MRRRRHAGPATRPREQTAPGIDQRADGDVQGPAALPAHLQRPSEYLHRFRRDREGIGGGVFVEPGQLRGLQVVGHEPVHEIQLGEDSLIKGDALHLGEVVGNNLNGV